MKESICLYSYRFGRFELQPGERRLLVAGEPAVVEPRAFDVLVALVERAGHLVTKEELFSLVWPHLVVEENNLQVQVSALRKILGPAAIATVSRQGYRFTLELTCEVIDSAPLAAAAKSDQPGVTFTGSGREPAKRLLRSSPDFKLLASSREPLHGAGESIYPVQAVTDIVPPIRLFPQALQTVPDAAEQAARWHPLAHLQRWPWLAGGVAVFLIAAAAWLYQTTKTTPQTTAAAEPPTLSIAILPFAAPADELLAATLMPEVTAAFWRNARSARMASPELVAPYQGKHVDARAIGHELNVRYVAAGEIRRAGDTRVLSASIIDANNGAQIWTDRFEVPPEELPGTYDAFATRVARHVWSALYGVEKDRVAHQSATSSTAIDLWLRGAAIDPEPLEGTLAARKFFEKALELDPHLVGAMGNLSLTYEVELDVNPRADGDRLRKDLDELSLRAIATDRTDPRAWVVRAMALNYNNRPEEALNATTELQRIEPNYAGAFAARALALIALGRSEDALAELDRGIALDPSGPDIGFLLRQKCKAYSYLGQYENAIATCEKAATNHQIFPPYIYLTADYAQLGEMGKAASAKIRLLKINPGFTIAHLGPNSGVSIARLGPNVGRNSVWVQQAETYVIPGLRKAGIPEN
jgi:DNA-binding winged helix-turn-helix (wHTH) protein/TolB-like protein